jgi:orotate phosphoribosyltransferase
MNLQQLATVLFHIGSLKVGSFTLKSGQESPVYVDLRQIISFPDILQGVSEAIWAKHEGEADLICGVPYTALPIATAISLKYHLPMVMRRKEEKQYGTKKKVEGVFEYKQRCVVVEDVVTTGASIMETIRDLEEAGLQVVEVVAFLDREQGARAYLEKQHGYPFRAAITLREIATILKESQLVDAATYERIIFQVQG